MDTTHSPLLIVQASADSRQIQLLKHREWTIGRDRANLIQIADRHASRFHAVLGVFEERHVYFRDLNSRNGSSINGQPITKPVLLKHGDRIAIGNTELVLKHHYVTTTQVPLPKSQKQVLMMHASAIQGKIWQEILLSQAIDILWEVPGADLTQIIGLQAAANILPPLLILDIQSVPKDIYGLGHWCNLQGVSVQILLTDSSRADIPESEQVLVKKLGFLNLLPAFAADQLPARQSDILQATRTILDVFQQSLSREALLSTLQGLDKLLNKTPHMVSASRQVLLNAANAEDLTRLKVDPRKLKKDQPR